MASFKSAIGKCGVALIIFGSLAVILGVAAIPIRTVFYKCGFAFWAALFFIIDGSLGITVSMERRAANGLTITALVLAIISIVFAAILIAFSSYAIIIDKYISPLPKSHLYDGIIAVHALDIFVGIGGGMSALCLSVFSCMALNNALSRTEENVGLRKHHNASSNDNYGTALEP